MSGALHKRHQEVVFEQQGRWLGQGLWQGQPKEVQHTASFRLVVLLVQVLLLVLVLLLVPFALELPLQLLQQWLAQHRLAQWSGPWAVQSEPSEAEVQVPHSSRIAAVQQPWVRPWAHNC
jgi:hypothetical protein